MKKYTISPEFRPRVSFNPKFKLNDSENAPYVKALAAFGMARIKNSARPYHEKHRGVSDRGATGKPVELTLLDIEKIIINSNGVSPNGVPIYFAPLGILRIPGPAEKAGLVTEEERNRFPSFDRIDSSKGYVVGNVQLTTKGFNLGKSSQSINTTSTTTLANISLKYYDINVEMSVSASFLADTLKQLANKN